MIPVVLYLLILGYALLVIGVIYEKNIIEKMASFLLLLLFVEIVWHGIATVNNTLTFGTAVITFGFAAYHLVRDFTVLNFDKKKEDDEEDYEEEEYE